MRIALSTILALLTTTGLFFGMRALIAGSEMVLDDAIKRTVIEFSRLREDSETRSKELKMPKRAKPKPPPSTPDVDLPDADAPTSGEGLGGPPPDLEADLNLDTSLNLGAAPADGDYAPIVRVNPIYPHRAEEMGIEGWVEVRFDVTTNGSTANVKVINAKPSGVFDRATVRAVKKWKYKPKVVDGKPQVTKGLTTTLNFELGE